MAKVAWTDFPSDGGHAVSPTREPDEGEVYTADGGKSFQRWCPLAPPTPQRTPITGGTFVKLVRANGGLSVADLSRFMQGDVTLGPFLELWARLHLEPLVLPSATVIGGLAAMEAASLLTAGGKDAVLAAWPTT